MEPTPGSIAYAAYLKSSGGKSLVTGALLPSFEEQAQPIRDAWEAAAAAVVEHDRSISL